MLGKNLLEHHKGYVYRHRCSHGVRGYCNECLEEYEKEHGIPLEEQNGERAVYKYTLPVQYELETVYSIGCRVCYLHAERIAKRTLNNYCARKNITPKAVDIQDAIQSTLTYLTSIGSKWTELCKEREREGIPGKALFARAVRNRYKDIVKQYVKREEVLIALDNEEDLLTRIPVTADQYRQVDRRLTMQAILNGEDYTVAKLMLSGYTQKDIARKLKVNQPAISKRLTKIREALQELQELQ